MVSRVRRKYFRFPQYRRTEPLSILTSEAYVRRKTPLTYYLLLSAFDCSLSGLPIDDISTMI